MDSQLTDNVVRSLECDPQRKSDMILSLRSRLESDTAEKGAVFRLQWLVSHLQDYLDRWTACISCFSMSAFIHNDLHVILRIGVDIVEEEQRVMLGGTAFREKWHEFAATVREIDENTDREIGVKLRTSLEIIRNELERLSPWREKGPGRTGEWELGKEKGSGVVFD